MREEYKEQVEDVLQGEGGEESQEASTEPDAEAPMASPEPDLPEVQAQPELVEQAPADRIENLDDASPTEVLAAEAEVLAAKQRIELTKQGAEAQAVKGNIALAQSHATTGQSFPRSGIINTLPAINIVV